MSPSKPLWIFGYGSLIFRPAFSHVRRERALVRGFVRRFWQGSPDHRGTPEAPGRVATLVPEPGAICDGVAYLVAPTAVNEVLAKLDHREQGGYERHLLSAHLRDGSVVEEVITYRATRDNPEYLGPAPMAEMARHILASRGPSGPNDEYVLELARALEEMEADDPHVFELASHIRRLRQRSDSR